MTHRQLVWTIALAGFVLALAGTVAVAAVPSLAGTVQSIQKDTKGKLASFVLQTKNARGQLVTVKVAVNSKTKFTQANCCATAASIQPKANVTVTLASAVRAGRGLAGSIKIAPPPMTPSSGAPAPKVGGG